jgi:hypothetical protein
VRFFAGPWADAYLQRSPPQPGTVVVVTFGNAVPHVHTHIVPRYPDDPAPGRPLSDEVFRNAPSLAGGDLADQVTRLRRNLLRAAAV